MFNSRDFRLEVLSAILGTPVKPDDPSSKSTCQKITNDELLFKTIFGNEAIKNQSLQHHPIDSQGGSGWAFSLKAKYEAILEPKFFLDESEIFDPQYDCDFTDLSTSESYERGGEPYERPYGWYRMALKVTDKYPDGNTWLGPNGWRSESAPGEWPVSYHGTSLDGAKGIIKSHYKAGRREAYGRGIYSTPKLSVASVKFSKTFQSKTNGKSYKIVLQNRINPKERDKCDREDYWLIFVKTGTSEEEGRNIVERSIRPYGILIQECKK